MTGQLAELKPSLEDFAQEAADQVAQACLNRMGERLSDEQRHCLVDGIWESLYPANFVHREAEATGGIHSL